MSEGKILKDPEKEAKVTLKICSYYSKHNPQKSVCYMKKYLNCVAKPTISEMHADPRKAEESCQKQRQVHEIHKKADDESL